MLNRDRSPAKGLWNGVGGKLEAGESPLAGVLREAYEETGIRLTDARFKGVVRWEPDRAPSEGMYLFIADLPPHVSVPTPRRTDEGLLEWKEIDWILSERNLGVGEAIPRYLPAALEEADRCYVHRCVLEGNRLVRYERAPLEPLLSV
jgi:8-oxo-dGTP diphosphatase